MLPLVGMSASSWNDLFCERFVFSVSIFAACYRFASPRHRLSQSANNRHIHKTRVKAQRVLPSDLYRRRVGQVQSGGIADR